MVLKQEDWVNIVYEVLVELGWFMGGFNFVLFVFNLFLVFNIGGFDSDV